MGESRRFVTYDALPAARRYLLSALFFVSLAGLGIAVVYLVVNVSVIPEKLAQRAHVRVDANPQQVESAAPQFARGSRLSVSFVRKFFEEISIDLSAITPFLLSWFFFNVVFNTGRFALGKLPESRLVEDADVLPMHRNYDIQWIQLGLIGTLWGFMIIGWEMKDFITGGGAQDTLNILMKAFGTALLSTFAGTVLGYVFGPVVILYWRFALGVDEPAQRSTETYLKLLDISLFKSSAAVKEATQATEELSNTLTTINGQVERIVPEKIQAQWNQLVEASEGTRGSANAIRQSLAEQPISDLKSEIKEVQSTLAAIHGTVNGSGEAFDRHMKALVTAITSVGYGTSKTVGEAVARVVETVDDRIEKLENNATIRNQSIINHLKALEKVVQDSETRARVTVEIHDLDRLEAVHERLIESLRAIAGAEGHRKRRRWWPWTRASVERTLKRRKGVEP